MIAKTPKTRYADHIKEWEDLSASLATVATDLPQLDLQRNALATFLSQARDFTQQQASFQSSKQKISVQLRTVMEEGMKVATALKVNLRQIYGNRSEDLVKFGIQPLRSRKSKEETPTPAPEATGGSPTPTPSPASTPPPTTTPHPAQ